MLMLRAKPPSSPLTRGVELDPPAARHTAHTHELRYVSGDKLPIGVSSAHFLGHLAIRETETDEEPRIGGETSGRSCSRVVQGARAERVASERDTIRSDLITA